MGLSPDLAGRVARLSEFLKESTIEHGRKEQLFAYIDAAAASANGAADKMQAMSETLLLTVLMLVEDQTTREAERVKLKAEVLRAHDESCVFKTAGGQRMGMLLLFKWPATIVIVVAMLTQNLDQILNVCKELF